MKKDIWDAALIPAIILTILADYISYLNNPELPLGILIVGSQGNFLISYFVCAGVIAFVQKK